MGRIPGYGSGGDEEVKEGFMQTKEELTKLEQLRKEREALLLAGKRIRVKILQNEIKMKELR